MTPEDALIELLGRVGAGLGTVVLVNDDELSQWPGAAVAAMKAQKLIAKARPASSALCPGCEHECVMPVHTLPATRGLPASFIVCDKRSDSNRVPIPSERLNQWKCSADSVCGFVATSLGLRRNDRETVDDGLWEIGLATGDKRSQTLCLQANGELFVVVGSNRVPIAELIEFHDGRYSLTGTMIRQLVDAATTADPRHTPTTVKREARKLETQTMYEAWQKAYRTSLRKKPENSDVWHSQQIAKLDIAQGRDASTIRKHMKK